MIDHMIIKLAWLDSKQAYLTNKNAECRADLVTYEKMVKRRDHFRNYIRIFEGRTHLSMEEVLS